MAAGASQRAVPVLDPQNVLWYFGALAGTAACVALTAEVPESARGIWILLVSLAFMAAYAGAVYVLRRAGQLVSAGVLAATAVTFVPLAGAAFERLVGIIGSGGVSHPGPWPPYVPGTPTTSSGSGAFHGSTFALALLTVAAGLGVYALLRYAYVFLWVAIAGVVAAELLVPAFESNPNGDAWLDAALATGLAFVVLGLYLDRRGNRRDAFWWHLVGLVAVTSALSYHAAAHASSWWIAALCAGIAALAIAVLLERATFAFFGLLGLYAPVVHWIIDWFGSAGTAAALALVGFGLLGAGLYVQRLRVAA